MFLLAFFLVVGGSLYFHIYVFTGNPQFFVYNLIANASIFGAGVTYCNHQNQGVT